MGYLILGMVLWYDSVCCLFTYNSFLGGGVNPCTPAYVGYLCIILRCQKHTSRYICITPLLVKLAYFLPPKKIWCDTYVSFFRQEPRTCAPVRVQSCADQNFFFRAFRTFSLCLLCIPCPRSCSRAQLQALLFCCA